MSRARWSFGFREALALSVLAWAMSQGTVRNLRDRRFDQYKTVWTDGG